MINTNIQRGAGITAIIAAFLPWITIGPISISGTAAADSDGWIMILLGIAALATTFWTGHRATQSLTAMLGGAIMAGDAIRILHDVSGAAPGPFGLTVSPGSGVILTLVAGCVLLTLPLAQWFGRYMAAHEVKDA